MCKLFLFLSLIASATSTGSLIQDQIPKCSSECAVTGIRKFYYIPSKTYTYDYKVKISASSGGVKSVKVTWHNKVELSWISPCDVVVKVRSSPLTPKENGNQTRPFVGEFPLVAAISGGVIQKICHHAEDPIESVNFKKGIVSILQNSLPSFSMIYNDKSFHELDVVGVCPTQYKIESKASLFVIKKFKNHKDCTAKHLDFENYLNKFIFASNFPISKSESKCHQEIKDGIFLRVSCTNEDVIRLNKEKYLKFEQNSELQYVSEKHKMPQNLSDIKAFVESNLMSRVFSDSHSGRDVELKLDQILSIICNDTLRDINQITPLLVTDVTDLLRNAKTETLINFYRKTASKKACHNSAHLKSIFFDVLSYITREGSLKLMIHQILSGHATAFRRELYIASILFWPQVNEEAMEHLIPVFRHPSSSPQTLIFMSANLIRKYCKTHVDHVQSPSIKVIFKELGKELQTFCPLSSVDEGARFSSITGLKAIGNIGYMDSQLQHYIFKCISSKKTDTAVQVAGIESFRLIGCSNEITAKLLRIATNVGNSAELRIVSFREVLRCAAERDLKRILTIVLSEKNKNVKSFLLSHLNRIMTGSFPHSNKTLKEYLLLHSKDLPRKGHNSSSRSSDYEYYFTSIGAGVEASVDVSMFPEPSTLKYEIKLSTSYLFQVLEQFDISIRIENFKDFFPYILEQLSKSESGIIKIIKPFLFSFLEEKGFESIAKESKENDSNITAKSRFDVQVKLFGIEFLYLSFQNDSLLFKENFFKILWTEINASSHTLEMVLKALSSTRALNFKLEAFIPSIHGISLSTRLQTTTLFGLDVEEISNDTTCTKENSLNCFILTPKFSSMTQIFIGYDLQPFFGIKVTNNLNLSEDVRYHLQTKEGQIKLYLLTPKGDLDILNTATIIHLLPENQVQLISKSLDSRLRKETCLNSMSDLQSFNFCWKYNLPNFETNTNVPLTFYTFKLYARKNNPNVTRIEMTSSWKYKTNCLEINTKLSSEDHLPHPKSMDLKVNFIDKEKYFSISTYLASRNNDLGLGMKISLEKTSTKRGYKNDISVYVSNTVRFTSSDKILYIKYIRGSEEDNTTIDVKMQTINAFASIIKFSFEAEFDYTSKGRSPSAPLVTDSEANRTTSHGPFRIPLKKSLGMHLKDVMEHPFNKKSVLLSRTLRKLSFKKLNLELESGAIHTNIFVQRVTSDHTSSQYRFWATVKVGHIKETIKGDVAFKGYKDDRSITISSDIFSESSTSNCHIKTELIDDNKKFDCRFTVENLNSKEVILMAKYSKERKSPSSIHFATNAEILVRGYIPHYVLTGEVAETQLGTYLINYIVKKNDDLLATIKGEIGLHSSINFIKERIHLNYTGTSGGSYELKGGYEFSHYKDKVVFSLVTLNNQLFYVRFALYRLLDCKECFTYSYEVQLPKIINGTVDGEMRLTELKFSSLFTVLPQSYAMLNVKSSCFVNFVQKQFETRLSYEVNRKKEKFEIISHYDIDSERRFVRLKGSLNAFSEEYRYNLEGTLGTPYGNDTNRHLLIGFFKPKGENYIFEAFYHKDVFDEFKGDVTTKFHLLTFEGEEFKWNSNFCYAFESNNSGLIAMGRAEFKTPFVEDVAIQFETNLRATEHQKSFIAKMNVTNKNHPQKSAVKIGFSLSPHEWKNETFILSIIRPIEFNFDLLNWGHKRINLTIQIDTNKENDFLIGINKNGNRQLGLNLKQHREKEFTFHVFTPTETVGFTFKISIKDVTLTLYPNQEWRNDNFDVKKLNAINILSNMAIEQTTMQGNINVNGTTSGSERILVSIESIKLSNGSYKTEAIFRSTYLKSNPRILFETTLAPSTKSLCLSFRQSSSAPSSVMIGGVYSTHPYLEFQKTFYGYLTFPKTTIELTSSHLSFPIGDVDQAGYSFINGTLNSSSLGAVHYSTCYGNDPVTLIMKTSSAEESSQVATYFGDYERHLSIKFNKLNESTTTALCTKDYENRNDEALKISSKLQTPSIISVEYYYNLIEMKNYADSVWRDLKKIYHLSSELTDELIDEFSKSLESNSQKSKFQRVISEVSKELHYLYQETELDQLFPDFSFWKMELRKLLEDTLEIFTAMTDKVRQIMTEYLLKIYATIIDEFEAVNRLIISTLEQWIRALEECSRSLMQHLSNFKSLDHIWKYAKETNIWKWVSGNWNELHTQIHDDISVVTKMMKISHTAFDEEVSNIWYETLNHSSVQFFVEEFRSWLNMGPLSIMTSVWRNTFDFKVNKESEHLRIGIPLIKKAYSLQTAEIGVPEDMNNFSMKETLEAIIYESIISMNINKCEKNGYCSISKALP